MDLTTGIVSRLTSDPADDTDPAWSPDERSIAFTSSRAGLYGVYVKNLVDGKEEPLTRGDPMVVDTWTPDGQSVVVRTVGRAVYTVSVHGDHTPRLLVDTPYTEDELHLSPDGRWVAFNSDESGRWEVYVGVVPRIHVQAAALGAGRRAAAVACRRTRALLPGARWHHDERRR